MKTTFYRRRGKRLLDVVGASIALILTVPIQGVTAALVRCRLGSPVLFSQERPGIDGRPFTLLKFRTMLDTCDLDGQPRPDGERLTALGQRLRATSIDELPELWNVLLGDMSLVGPRPLLTEYLPLYSASQSRRHLVRPGITGWAQVNGRNALLWPEKFDLDVWYVNNVSLPLDLRILWRTVAAVVRRSDVSAAGEVTAARFLGSE